MLISWRLETPRTYKGIHIGDLETGDWERVYLKHAYIGDIGEYTDRHTQTQGDLETGDSNNLYITVHKGFILEIWRLETGREYTRKHAYTGDIGEYTDRHTQTQGDLETGDSNNLYITVHKGFILEIWRLETGREYTRKHAYTGDIGEYTDRHTQTQGDLETGDSNNLYITVHKGFILEIWRLETLREYTRKHAYTGDIGEYTDRHTQTQGDLETGDSNYLYITVHKGFILEIWRLETLREYTRKHAYTGDIGEYTDRHTQTHGDLETGDSERVYYKLCIHGERECYTLYIYINI